MAKKKNTGKPQQQSDNHPTNVWDAVIAFLNISYDLLNSGNIFGLLLLLMFGVVAISLFKMPDEHIKPFIEFLVSPFFKVGATYYVLFGGVAFSIYGNVYQRVSYRKEIKRLTDIRKELVHGKKSGELKEIENHTSSKTEL